MINPSEIDLMERTLSYMLDLPSVENRVKVLPESINVFEKNVSPLPKSYKNLLLTAGLGTYFKCLVFYSPGGLMEKYLEIAHDLFEDMRSYREDMEDWIFYPKDKGLLAFGTNDSAWFFFNRKSSTNPDRWSIVIFDDSSGFTEIGGDVVDLLGAIKLGTPIISEFFPDFVIESRSFKRWGGE